MTPQWILRRGSKDRGFRYITPAGQSVRDAAVRARIAALGIPPAWRDVHIAVGERAAVQAWGIDAKGRKQYRYHVRAVQRGESRKHYRVRRLALDLPRIRAAVARDLRGRTLTRERVAAGVVRLLAQGFFRVGSERYARENKTFGIATLRKSHVTFRGEFAVFRYMGKRSIAQRQVIVDARVVTFVKELLETPGSRLFRYESDEGWSDLTARDVNDYMRRISGARYSAKDFRTWGGTLLMATVLAELGPGDSTRDRRRNVMVALRLVAAELGNTPAICRTSYVHPLVIARYVDEGDTIAPRLARQHSTRHASAAAHSPEERALIAFLDRHFPERRRQLRAEERPAA